MSIGYKATGDIGLWGEGTTWHGVIGTSQGGFGVWGHNDTGGTGVVGESSGWHGAAGFSDSTTGGAGLYGEHRGTGAGVVGKCENGTGVLGDTISSQHPAVWGHNRGGGDGILGTADRDGAGVSGSSSNGPGVLGISPGGPGVEGVSSGLNNPAVSGQGRIAGDFQGIVRVAGNFQVVNGTKNFKIDHPLDPQNKYLLHNAVESSEMKNVYDGVAQLDADGTASVELPEWFEALNGDFRYQLTAVGGTAPNLHVAEEISENRFRIAGGEGTMKVCWQVTGSRKDPWATATPFEVEQETPQEERGHYLQPDLYDAPEEQSIMRTRMVEETLRKMMREEAPLMPPPGSDRPPEERRRQTYELRRQAEAQEYQQQIDELRRQIEELRRQQ
jgi:hypothetical protein